MYIASLDLLAQIYSPISFLDRDHYTFINFSVSLEKRLMDCL